MAKGSDLSGRARTRWVLEAGALVPFSLVLGIVIAWLSTGGGYESLPTLAGYDPDPWYLGALGLVVVLVSTLVALGLPRLSRPALLALVALVAYTGWSFLSIVWAHDQGAALHGSDRALVYLAAFALFVSLPWSPRSLRVALGGLVVGCGVLAAVTAIRVALDGNPSSLYIDDRLSFPLGYYNADAALFMTTALVAVALAARRSTAAVLRPAAVGLAGLCLQLALLSQSRGWLFTAPLVVLVALPAVPNRLRLLACALGPAIATAAAAPALLDVYSKANNRGFALSPGRLAAVLHARGHHAIAIALVADVVLVVLAAAAVAIDRRVVPSQRTQQRAARAGAVLAALAVLAAVSAGLLATHGHVVSRVEHAWRSFTSTSTSATSSSRFTSLGSQRSDFWRVALHETGRHPLGGIGQDNFADSYLARRHTDQEPRWAHSLELRLLVHTGVVGLLLFGTFLLAALVAALRSGVMARERRVAAGLALLPLIVWVVHGSVDWFWEFPALSVPALGFLGAAAALGGDGRGVGSRGTGGRVGRLRRDVVAAAVVAALAATSLVALAIPYLAARDVQHAVGTWTRDPSSAFSDLRAATSLVSFDPQPYLVGGAIALNTQQPGSARAWLQDAAARDMRAWLPPLLLGVIAGQAGDHAGARTLFARARALNPSEPLTTEGLSRAGTSRPLTLADVRASIAQRSGARFGG